MDTIYRGDAFPISIAWEQPDSTNPFIEDPITPIDATVKVVRERDGKAVIPNGTASITNNVTAYLVAPSDIGIDGAYTAYVTATFIDGNVQSKQVRFTVVPKQ